MPNCLDCTIETQAVYHHHRQSIAMNTCTCCCRVGKCTLLTIMQISDRLSVIGLFWWHQYRISVHAKNAYWYTSNINRVRNFFFHFQKLTGGYQQPTTKTNKSLSTKAQQKLMGTMINIHVGMYLNRFIISQLQRAIFQPL